MISGFLKNIPDSKTPGVCLIFPVRTLGFLIVPKSQSKIIFPFSVKNGYPQASPYDRIIITAACTEIPLPLLDQLSENGLIIAPVGGASQSLVLLQKTSKGIVEIKNQSKYVFVPLVGKFGKK